MSFDNMPMQGYSGWNVNAPYMTPAYMANFRPTYAQGDSNNPYAQHHSVGSSLWTLGPGDLGYGADALGTLAAHRYNVANSPFDASMQGLQSVAIPLATWYAADRMIGKTGLGAAMGRRMGSGAASAAGWGARRMGMGSIAGGASRLGMGSLAGGAGAFAGGMLMPVLAGQAMSTMIDSTLIDPYVSTRRGMDAMRANTYGTAITGQGGAHSGGFGMSATRAHEISQALTESGQADFSLSGGTYNEIADNMMRAGIFQEVGDMDTDRIVDGVKKATGVLKMISRITGDNDIQSGIKTLAMLKSGGLDDIEKMGQAMQQIRNASTISGTSVNQILDTVGRQGMVMAQQTGMRGVTGLLASADAYAGFTNARREGLISGAQMQALGGAEGMTQNLMSGVMQMMQSPYARMTMQGGGEFGGGISSNIAKWGDKASIDPIAAQGDWFVNQGAYTDEAMNDMGGPQSTLRMLKDMAKSANLDPENGLYLGAMAEKAGLTTEQFRSIIEYDKSQRDPIARMAAAQKRTTGERADFASEMQQEGLGMIGAPGIGDVQLGWLRFKAKVKKAGAEAMSNVSALGASMSDSWEEMDANVKGLNLDYQMPNYIVDDEGEGSLFELQGKSMIDLGTDQRTGERVTKLSAVNDSQNSLIGALNRVHASAEGDIKRKTADIITAIYEGDTEKAASLYREVDAKTKGALSGKKDSIEQEFSYKEFEEKVRNKQLTAKKTVIGADSDAPMSSTLSEGAFMDAISIGESGKEGYDAKVGNNRFDKGFIPTESTVGQVLAQQMKSRGLQSGSAVGKFQFVYPTLKELTDNAIREGRLDPDQKFDKGVQDMLAKDLAMRNPDIAAYVNSPNPTAQQEEKAMDAMAGIWASFPMADGRTRYPGNNKAHVTRSQSREAARDLRSQGRRSAPTPYKGVGEVSSRKDLMKRLRNREVSYSDANAYLATKDEDAILRLLNDGSNTSSNLDDLAEKINQKASQNKSTMPDGPATNYDGVVDLKDGIGGLKSATSDNTSAVEELTKTLNKPVKGGRTLLDTILEAVN